MMADRALRKCIRDFLRFVQLHSVQIRRRCDNQWCYELKHLSGDKLINRLKYLIWWAPLRNIVTAYNRGILQGQRVIMCVYEELRRRGLQGSQSVRGIADEIKSKYFLQNVKSENGII